MLCVGQKIAGYTQFCSISSNQFSYLVERGQQQTLNPLAAIQVSCPAQTLPDLNPSRHTLHDRRFSMS